MRILCLLSICAMLIGCGDSNSYKGPQRLPLSGKVTFDGEQVDAGTISFVPQSKEHRPAGGVITQGAYSIPEAQGVNEGTYKVEIRWSRPTGEKILDAEDTGEMIDVTKQVIPEKFNTQTELSAEVSKEKTTFDFELKSE